MAFLTSSPDSVEGSPGGSHTTDGNIDFAGGQLLEEYQPSCSFELEDYARFIEPRGIEALRQLAKPVEGRGWVNVNSTFSGGGVAEMLRSAVPFARLLGVDPPTFSSPLLGPSSSISRSN